MPNNTGRRSSRTRWHFTLQEIDGSNLVSFATGERVSPWKRRMAERELRRRIEAGNFVPTEDTIAAVMSLAGRERRDNR